MHDMSGWLEGLQRWCLDVLKGDPLTVVPTAGIIGFLLGMGLAIKSRRWRLIVFIVPSILCFAFAYLPDCLRGHMADDQFDWLLEGLLLLLTICLGYLVFRFKDARWAAFFLAIFVMCLALIAAAGAEMAFTGMWI